MAKVACTGERMALLKGWLAELFVASDFPAIGQRGYQLLLVDLELIHGVA